jgi:hypothetical protein
MYYSDQVAVSCSNTAEELRQASGAVLTNIVGVSGILMNLTHNAGLAFEAILSVKAFFAG